MPLPKLDEKALATIETGVDELFEKLKARLIHPYMGPKQIVVGYFPELSLPGIFEAASKDGGVKPDQQVLQRLQTVATKYIDAVKERTKARMLHDVAAFLTEAELQGVRTDVKTVLGGKLSEAWRDVSNQVGKIVDYEVQGAKNFGILDGILKLNHAQGIDDPTVFFVVVRDNDLCEECRRLHLRDDGVTPRAWKLSDIGHGYHKKGESNPKMEGLHPHCRCSMATLLEGYGFISGKVGYIGPGHDEYEKQHRD